MRLGRGGCFRHRVSGKAYAKSGLLGQQFKLENEGVRINLLPSPQFASFPRVDARSIMPLCFQISENIDPLPSSAPMTISIKDDDLPEELHVLRRQLAAMQEAAAEQERVIEALRVGKEQYRLLLDESSDPIFSFFPEGRYAYVNREFAAGLGMMQEEIIGRTLWDIFPQDEADKRFAAVKWVYENGERKVIEVRVPRPDGDRYYITTVKPILDGEGRVLSVICISKEITERKRMEDRLAHMAQHDTLTDLPNRALFSDRLLRAISQARRDNAHLALMCLDLDKFKPVNDNFGHHVGDMVLQAAAIRMQACLRESDTVGRIGGDEFIILLPVVENIQDVLLVAEKIRTALASPFDLSDGSSIEISSSIGITIFPDHGVDEIQLMKNADQALYRAKAEGRNQVCVFGTT